MTEVNRFNQGRAYDLVATIPMSSDLSDELNNHGSTLVGLKFPAAFDGANIRFLGSIDDGQTFQQIYDDAGIPFEIVVKLGEIVALDPRDLSAFRWVKLKSTSVETAERKINGINRSV